MKLKILLNYIWVFTCIIHLSLSAQSEDDYILNGSAVKETCNCYLLTPDIVFQSGSVWNKTKIDLSKSFNFLFNVYLGCKDQDGSGGIAFVMQPLNTSQIADPKGPGFKNISPSVVIPIDTRQNMDFNDPDFDYTGIYKNGDLRNGNSNTLAGPVQALTDNPNIEDCKWHTLRIIWDANAKVISAEIDNAQRVISNIDLVNDIFAGNPSVFWGFTGISTDQSNIQKFCTALNPGILAPAGVKSCNDTPIPFDDNSKSFGTITNWWWDFGDGTLFSGQHPLPHIYSTPGFYTIKMNIQSEDGCISDTLYRSFIIGSVPTAGFTTLPKTFCADQEALFLDSSRVDFGKINLWNWNLNSTQEIKKSTPGLSKIFSQGQITITLTTETEEGCSSKPFVKTMDITPKPSTDLEVQPAACSGDPILMTARNITPEIPIRQWYWDTGDGNLDSTSRLNYFYKEGGEYHVSLYALNEAGCSSDTSTARVKIYQTDAKTGNDTTLVSGIPFQMHASGGEFYQWTPRDGLSDPQMANPIANIASSKEYIVKAYTVFGCATYDTIHIKVFKGPAIYAPNAFTPDNNGINDRFHPVLVGIQSIGFFEVFNRLGQLVYKSQADGAGWDGNFKGSPQPAGAYVWLIKGQDYLGNIHIERGTVVLIR